MEYNKTEVYGKLYAGKEQYWIVSPHPEVIDDLWDDLMERAFFGVNEKNYKWGELKSEYQDKQIFPVPYAIIVSGTWHIELRPPMGDSCIWCEKPSLLEESAATEDDEFEELDLIGDLVRSDDYRFINGEFEEENWNEEDLEDAELEEEEILVEEG